MYIYIYVMCNICAKEHSIPKVGLQFKETWGYVPHLLQPRLAGGFRLYNTWTEADNYLLVEKLVSKCEEESWNDVAELVDSSGTFETESFKCKAVRKYAFFHGVPVESCKVQEVAATPQGLQGWAEMNVCIPGLNDGETSSGTPDSAATDQGQGQSKGQG